MQSRCNAECHHHSLSLWSFNPAPDFCDECHPHPNYGSDLGYRYPVQSHCPGACWGHLGVERKLRPPLPAPTRLTSESPSVTAYGKPFPSALPKIKDKIFVVVCLVARKQQSLRNREPHFLSQLQRFWV